MILEAKDSIGRIPAINPDLLNIKEEYLDKGDSLTLSQAFRVTNVEF